MLTQIKEMEFKCKRCGKCCLTIPCVFAQVRYHLTSKSEKVCPELVSDGDSYKCLLVERDSEAQIALITGDCDNPALVHMKKKIDAIPIVKEYFPSATQEEIGNILWNYTSFPDFWNIPEDGWTPSQCLRKQLRELSLNTAGAMK